MSESERWDLSSEEVASLLGGISIETYNDLKFKAANNIPFTLTKHTIERLSLLLGTWKLLQLLAPNDRQELAYLWFNKSPNSLLLNNKSIKAYLLSVNTIEAFHDVNQYLYTQHYPPFYESLD